MREKKCVRRAGLSELRAVRSIPCLRGKRGGLACTRYVCMYVCLPATSRNGQLDGCPKGFTQYIRHPASLCWKAHSCTVANGARTVMDNVKDKMADLMAV